MKGRGAKREKEAKVPKRTKMKLDWKVTKTAGRGKIMGMERSHFRAICPHSSQAAVESEEEEEEEDSTREFHR